jgi:hypothetical protein
MKIRIYETPEELAADAASDGASRIIRALLARFGVTDLRDAK